MIKLSRRDRIMQITQSEMQTERQGKKKCQFKYNRGSKKRREMRIKNIFEETMAENSN